jgi:hypothetical protein
MKKNLLFLLFTCPFILTAQNLLTNPSFEDGTVTIADAMGTTTDWKSPYGVTGATVSSQQQQGTYSLQGTTTGNDKFNALLWSPEMSVTQGKTYYYSYWIKADGAYAAGTFISNSTVNSTYQGGQSFTTSTTWVNKSGTVVADGNTAYFRFDIGNAGTYYIDNLSFREAITTTSLISSLNSGFETGITNQWYNYSVPAGTVLSQDRTDPYVGTAALKSVTATANAVPGRVGLNIGSVLTAGKTYKLTFAVKGSTSTTARSAPNPTFLVQAQAGPGATPAYATLGTTGQIASAPSNWTQYQFTFVAPNVVTGTSIDIQVGTEAGTLFFDDFIVVETTPVPVELIEFKAAAINKKVNLAWKVATEDDMKLYDVERSKDGQNFEIIGSVKAVNLNTTVNYAFTDANPLAGVGFYRLKLNKQSERFEYSKIQSVSLSDKGKISVFPNPTKAYVQISTGENVESLQLFDLSGRLVRQFAPNQPQLDMTDLAKGIYHLSVKTATDMSVHKIVKMD